MDIEYKYTEEELKFREHLIYLIEREKDAFLRRIEPYEKQLAKINDLKIPVIRLSAEESSKLSERGA